MEAHARQVIIDRIVRIVQTSQSLGGWGKLGEIGWLGRWWRLLAPDRYHIRREERIAVLSLLLGAVGARSHVGYP